MQLAILLHCYRAPFVNVVNEVLYVDGLGASLATLDRHHWDGQLSLADLSNEFLGV